VNKPIYLTNQCMRHTYIVVKFCIHNYNSSLSFLLSQSWTFCWPLLAFTVRPLWCFRLQIFLNNSSWYHDWNHGAEFF